jgi:hypothetical protein
MFESIAAWYVVVTFVGGLWLVISALIGKPAK